MWTSPFAAWYSWKLLPSLNSSAYDYRRKIACCCVECLLHGLTEFIIAKTQECARSVAGGYKHHEEWSSMCMGRCAAWLKQEHV